MMKSLIVGLAGLLIAALAPRPAAAWSHSGYHGSASGGGGSWERFGKVRRHRVRGRRLVERNGCARRQRLRRRRLVARGEHARGVLPPAASGSWSAHGAAGGTASGGGGTFSSKSAYGTSTYHTSGYYGGATTHTNYSGGTTSTYHTTNYYGGSYSARTIHRRP